MDSAELSAKKEKAELNRWRLQQMLMIFVILIMIFFTFQVGESNVLAIRNMTMDYCGPAVNSSADLFGNFFIYKNTSGLNITSVITSG